MSRVLVVGWSQSGQLDAVRERFSEALRSAGHEVAEVRLQPVEPFPFPWTVGGFFGEFPETVGRRPRALRPTVIPAGEWDLVVLVAQVWFLSPSQPFEAFLQSPEADVLRGRRVLTLVSCRNMWVSGWRKLVLGVQARGGIVTDRMTATQTGSVFSSYFSTLAWMLTGQRDAIRVLPKAGLSDAALDRVTDFGAEAGARLQLGQWPLLNPEMAITLSPPHAFGEQLVEPIFRALGRVVGLTPHGSVLRGLCAWGLLAFILSCVFGLLIPCVLTEWLLRARIGTWLRGLTQLPVTA